MMVASIPEVKYTGVLVPELGGAEVRRAFGPRSRQTETIIPKGGFQPFRLFYTSPQVGLNSIPGHASSTPLDTVAEQGLI